MSPGARLYGWVGQGEKGNWQRWVKKKRRRGEDNRGGISQRGEKSARLKGTERWRECGFTMKRQDTNDD